MIFTFGVNTSCCAERTVAWGGLIIQDRPIYNSTAVIVSFSSLFFKQYILLFWKRDERSVGEANERPPRAPVGSSVVLEEGELETSLPR